MKKFTTEEQKLKKMAYDAEYRKNNREKLRLKQKEKYNENKDIFSNRMKRYHAENKDKQNEKKRKYWDANKKDINLRRKLTQPKINENTRIYYKKRRQIDPLFKLRSNIRTSICTCIRKKGYKKINKTEQILGCNFEQLREHLEKQFQPWMNWENYGTPTDKIIEANKTWDVDHIIPLKTAKTEEDIIRLNHYTNLQPLCSYYNRFIKKDKL